MSAPAAPAAPSAPLVPLSVTTSAADPQDVYRQLRGRYGTVAPVELEPGVTGWLVLGWSDICQVVRRPRLFSRDPRNWRAWQEGSVAADSGLGPMMFPRDNAYFRDGEEHARLRRPLDDGIAGIPLRRMRLSVARTCEALIETFAGRGSADLVSEYAAVIPMLAVSSLFGLNPADGMELQRALAALFGSGEDAQAGNRRFEEIIGAAIAVHRRVPERQDLTAAFLRHPNLRSGAEVAQSMVLMISAGYETTATWIAQSLRLFFTHPRFSGAIPGWRPTTDDALDEVLWHDPPMANMPARFAMRDTTLGRPERLIQRGDALILGLSAAGSDPVMQVTDRWMAFGNRSHLAWSTGPHACPAPDLARIITRVAVETAFSELPGLRLAVPPGQITFRPSPWTRCPASLPVLFSPQPPAGARA